MIYESERKMTYKEQEAYDLGYLNGKRAAICSPWVKPSDRLPLHFSNKLVVMGGKITLGLYDCNCWFFYNEDKNKWEMDEYDRVTHWMPLPKLPEVEE